MDHNVVTFMELSNVVVTGYMHIEIYMSNIIALTDSSMNLWETSIEIFSSKSCYFPELSVCVLCPLIVERETEDTENIGLLMNGK